MTGEASKLSSLFGINAQAVYIMNFPSWLRPLIALVLFCILISLGSKYFFTRLFEKLDTDSNLKHSTKFSNQTPFYDSIPTQSTTDNSKSMFPPLPREQYTVELTHFSNKAKAANWASKLRDKGYQAFVTPIQFSNGSIKFYVRIGVYNTQKAAAKLANSLTRATGRPVAVKAL